MLENNMIYLVILLVLLKDKTLITHNFSFVDKMPKSGLLQSGLITLYIMYLTWSAMANNPDPQCNPMLAPSNTTTTDSTTSKPDQKSMQHMDTTSIIGLVIWFLCLLYSSISTSSSSQATSKCY